MPELPNTNDLYGEFRDEVESDPESSWNDFSTGSMLDAFAGVAAMLGRAVMRWILRQMRRAFISTAKDGDLEFVAEDTYGTVLTRREDESFSEYKPRVLDYRDEGLERGTSPALVWYTESLDGVLDAVPEEDFKSGITTIRAAFNPDQRSASDIRADWNDLLDEWRMTSAPTNLELYEDELP